MVLAAAATAQQQQQQWQLLHESHCLLRLTVAVGDAVGAAAVASRFQPKVVHSGLSLAAATALQLQPQWSCDCKLPSALLLLVLLTAGAAFFRSPLCS